MSNFTCLKPEWPALHEAAGKAETSAYPDPRTACFHARRGLEIMVDWLYRHDASFSVPYQET